MSKNICVSTDNWVNMLSGAHGDYVANGKLVPVILLEIL